MEPAFKAWQKSEHFGVSCHDCHYLSNSEKAKLLFNFIVKRPKAMPERHGEVIVPWKMCIRCHWERNKKYANAPLINRSKYHAKHMFEEQIECSECHGYITHKFITEEKFCLKCHVGKKIHGIGMKKLACLNCHTDRTRDLRPEKKKCLFCHGGGEVRKELIEEGTIDIKHFLPAEKTIKKAVKIKITKNAPMQFYCYECHKPHEKARPDWSGCLRCHGGILKVGKHEIHIKDAGMSCKECHKPHLWKVTRNQARSDCVNCHQYRNPETFVGP